MDVPKNSLAVSARAIPASGLAAVRPRPTGAAEPGGITPNDIWRIIRRRAWVIAIASLILIVLGVAINIAWRIWWPKWSGVAVLQVDSPVIQEAMAARQVPPANVLEMAAKAEARRIISRTYARSVLRDSKVRETDWYKKYNDNVDAALIDFEKVLSVSPLRGTPLIQVSFYTRNKEDAPAIVSTLTRIYLDDRREQARTELVQKLAGLQEQESRLGGQLQVKDREINIFIEKEKIPLTERQTDVETQLSYWAKAAGDMQMVQSSSATAMENIKGQTPVSWTPSAMYKMRIDSDPSIRSLTAYLLNLKEERETQGKRLGYDHPYIKRLDERIRISGRDIKNRTAELKQELFGEYVGSLQQAEAANQAILIEINTEIKRIRTQQEELGRKIFDYRNMEIARESLRESVKKLGAIIDNTKATLSEARNRGTQVTLASAATVAPKPSSPQLLMNLVATVFLSIMVGSGLAFLLEFMDKKVRSSQDIRRHIKLNMLGSIPDLEEDEANPEDMYSVVTHAPRSLLAEAFRQIRTNIMFSCAMRNCRSMLITSVAADDGRTCIAVNLAASIALSGKRVLLIDANFRRPALKQLFPNLPDVGFAQLVAGEATAKETIFQSDTPGLWVMSNGQTSTHHSGIMGGARLGAVIEQLSDQFDQVILDGPPALVSADALTLSGQVGGIVFVVRAGENSQGEINRMYNEISSLNTHIHGVVLNGVEAVRGGYLRKHYRKFYDYEESLAQIAAEVAPRSPEEESQPEPPEQS